MEACFSSILKIYLLYINTWNCFYCDEENYDANVIFVKENFEKKLQNEDMNE